MAPVISLKLRTIQLHNFNFADFVFNFEQFLEEEIAAQREGDLPTVCDKLKDKWHLPHDTYNMFVSTLSLWRK